MRIGEVAKKFNISIETLRYYDNIGILVPKRIGSIREYTEDDLKELRDILSMKKLMFTLEEIKVILRVDKKIEEGLKNNAVNKEEINSLLNILRLKQAFVISMKNDISEIEKRLENIVGKMEGIIGDDFE